MRGYLFLVLSILFEVAGSAMLKLSDGFTHFIPSLFLILFYGVSFTLFVLALRTISLSVGYSMWAGIGTAGTAIVGVIAFQEVLTSYKLIGLLIIILGVIVMNSKRAEQENPTAVN